MRPYRTQGSLATVVWFAGRGSDSPITTPPPAGWLRTIDGTVTGLAADQRVVLQNQGADDYAVGANGAFVTAAASWPLGCRYALTVKTQPTAMQCTVT